MSTTQRHSYREALAAAEAFRRLFPPDTYERWEFGGSLRRRCGDVGDLEHVVIPAFADVPSRDLFATPERVNVLWQRADQLVQQGLLARHLYANGQRWGQKYRGCDFAHAGRVHLHEIFCADADNWGSTLAIRTGPAEFSRKLVTSLQWHGHMNDGGYVWDKSRMRCTCGWAGDESAVAWVTAWEGKAFIKDPDGRDGGPFAAKCPDCSETAGVGLTRVSVPDEDTYFKLAGMAYTRPEARR